MKRGPSDDLDAVKSRILSRKKNVKYPEKHLCSRSYCNPENEGLGFIYVCDYGSVHECGQYTCQLGVLTEHGEYVCPISGLIVNEEEHMQYTHFNDDEEPQWHIVKDKKLPVKMTTHQKLHSKTQIILANLFLNKIRQRINDTQMTNAKNAVAQKVNRYIQLCKQKQKYVKVQKILRIHSNVYNTMFKYTILTEIPEKRIFDVVLFVWDNVIMHFYGRLKLYQQIPDAPEHPNMEYLILAIISYMKSYYTINGAALIPYDDFVSAHMIREKDITTFGYDIKKLRSAKTLLHKFYQKAMELNLNVYYNAQQPKEEPIVVKEESLVFKPVSRGVFCMDCKRKHEGDCK